MPIYAYKCASCGHAKDVLQKISDAPLKVCPSCGAEAFTKQVTAAGFQLKGSGWYATDFKGGGSNAPAPEKSDSAPTSDAKSSQSGEGKPADTKAPAKTETAKPSDSGSSTASSTGSSTGSGNGGKSGAPSASAGGSRGVVAGH